MRLSSGHWGPREGTGSLSTGWVLRAWGGGQTQRQVGLLNVSSWALVVLGERKAGPSLHPDPMTQNSCGLSVSAPQRALVARLSYTGTYIPNARQPTSEGPVGRNPGRALGSVYSSL